MRGFIQTAFVIMAGLFLSACSREVTVKIGVVAPMSGPSAELGMDIANGARVAIDELNTDHFRIDGKRARFELVVEDDKASEDEGKAAAKRLIDAGVAMVFGHLNSGVSIAAAPLYANAGIPQISASTNPKYTRMGLKTTFRIVADDIEQSAMLVRLIHEKLRAKSIHVIDDRTTFGMGISNEVVKLLKERKIEALHDSIDPGSTDYVELVRKIGESKADVVFYGGDEVAGVPLLNALKTAGSSVRFVTGDGMCDISSLKNAEGATGNFYCSVTGVPPSWLSSGVGFMQLFKSRFGEPGAYSPLAYDAIHIAAQAMQRANSVDPHIFLPELSKGAFDGKVQGSVEFDQNGDMRDGTVVIYKSVGGKLVEQRNLL